MLIFLQEHIIYEWGEKDGKFHEELLLQYRNFLVDETDRLYAEFLLSEKEEAASLNHCDTSSKKDENFQSSKKDENFQSLKKDENFQSLKSSLPRSETNTPVQFDPEGSLPSDWNRSLPNELEISRASSQKLGSQSSLHPSEIQFLDDMSFVLSETQSLEMDFPAPDKFESSQSSGFKLDTSQSSSFNLDTSQFPIFQLDTSQSSAFKLDTSSQSSAFKLEKSQSFASQLEKQFSASKLDTSQFSSRAYYSKIDFPHHESMYFDLRTIRRKALNFLHSTTVYGPAQASIIYGKYGKFEQPPNSMA